MLFDHLRDSGYEAVQKLIAGNPLETPYFDFKSKGNPPCSEQYEEAWTPYPSDKRNYAKGLSGFANGAGGVLIWGIGEKGSGPNRQLTNAPIHQAKAFAEALNHELPNAVSPAVDGVQNELVYVNDDPSQRKGYVLTLVPMSDKMPHRAEYDLHRYYRRVGDNMVELDHYMLAEAFGTRQQPSLSITRLYGYDPFVDSSQSVIRYALVMEVTNEGRASALHYGVDLILPEPIGVQDARTPSNATTAYTREGDSTVLRFRNSPGHTPLFPGDVTSVWPHAGGHVYLRVRPKDDQPCHRYDVGYRIYADGMQSRDGTLPIRLYKEKPDGT